MMRKHTQAAHLHQIHAEQRKQQQATHNTQQQQQRRQRQRQRQRQQKASSTFLKRGETADDHPFNDDQTQIMKLSLFSISLFTRI